MKKLLRSLQLFLLAMASSILVLAQETKEVDISIGTEEKDNFFAQPWVWIVGAAVFILLLVAILRGGSKSTE